MAVVVIVPVHNGGERFHANMDSIRRAEPPPDEVIVIGDGDTDGSSQFAEAAGITVYRFPTPKGPSRARNLGASKAMSELLLSVDVAGTVPENVIDRVRDLFARDSDVAAMIGSYDDQPGVEIFFLSTGSWCIILFIRTVARRRPRFGVPMVWRAEFLVYCCCPPWQPVFLVETVVMGLILFILNYGAR